MNISLQNISSIYNLSCMSLLPLTSLLVYIGIVAIFRSFNLNNIFYPVIGVLHLYIIVTLHKGFLCVLKYVVNVCFWFIDLREK